MVLAVVARSFQITDAACADRRHPGRYVGAAVAMEFLWVDRFEEPKFIDHQIQVTIVTRANEHLVLQMDWETFDEACLMFSNLKPNG